MEGTILGVDNKLRQALLAVRDAANNADHNHSLMHRIAIDGVVWSVCLCVYVMEMNPTKTAELIEMPFGSGGPT